MEILLQRSFRNKNNTIGLLSIDGKFECFTCEDKDRGLKQTDSIETIQKVKVPGQTVIPEGRYKVVITFSNRFQKDLPLLVDVPGYSGVRIHPGNTAKDTDGCLLPGTDHNDEGVINSRAAFLSLFDKIKASPNPVFITIK